MTHTNFYGYWSWKSPCLAKKQFQQAVQSSFWRKRNWTASVRIKSFRAVPFRWGCWSVPTQVGQSSESSLLWLQWGITFSQLERDTLKYAMYRAICLLGSLLCVHRSIAQIHWFCLLQIGFEVSPLYLMTLKGKTNQKTGWNVILGQASEMNYAWLQWMTRIHTGIKLAINALCFGVFLHFCS